MKEKTSFNLEFVNQLNMQAYPIDSLGDKMNNGNLINLQGMLFLLVAVERQRGRELLNKRIDQLLLVVAQVTSGGQGGQQNTVLGMAVHQPPLEGRAAGGKRRQAARAQMTPFIVAGDVRLTGKFLMVFLIFNVVFCFGHNDIITFNIFCFIGFNNFK